MNHLQFPTEFSGGPSKVMKFVMNQAYNKKTNTVDNRTNKNKKTVVANRAFMAADEVSSAAGEDLHLIHIIHIQKNYFGHLYAGLPLMF